MTDRFLVTVLIPARDEEANIERCIEAIGSQDYPLDMVEVAVIDGCSKDRTVEVAKSALDRFSFRRTMVLSNPRGTTPSSLNLGLSAVTGEVVCRVDARSFIPPNYVRTCVNLLASRPDVVVVGGAQIAIPPRPGLLGNGIARALNNRYATGLSRYRRRSSSGEADTVYLGAFRTAELLEVSGWDERFRTNQDFELNRRLGRRGRIWFDEQLTVYYLPRASLRDLQRQYRRFGRWKAAAWLEGEVGILPRQLALLITPAMALAVGLVTPVRRRLPLLLTSAVATGIVLLASRRHDSPEWMVEAIVVTVIGASWWLGALEQITRYLAGERLLEDMRVTASSR